LSAVEAAPLMCASVTTYNALRNSDSRNGDLVAILGIGGHLGIQFAAKMGFDTVTVDRGKDKEELRSWVQGNTLIAGRKMLQKNLSNWEEPKSYLELFQVERQ